MKRIAAVGILAFSITLVVARYVHLKQDIRAYNDVHAALQIEKAAYAAEVTALQNGSENAMPVRDCPCGCARNEKDCYKVCKKVENNQCVLWADKCDDVCIKCTPCDHDHGR